MPRYLHIPHTPDTARTLTLSGRNCLVVSGMVTPPLKSATGAKKGAEANIPEERVRHTGSKVEHLFHVLVVFISFCFLVAKVLTIA